MIAIIVLSESFGAQGGTAVRTRNVTGEGIKIPKETTPWIEPATVPLLQAKRVKCYYFKIPPVRTYCHVLDLEGPITALEANQECKAISMNLLSIETTPQHRICTLMKVFKLDETKLWIADISDTLPDSSLSRCNLEVLNETVTNVDRRCNICSIAVVCDAGFYHSNGANCVTVEEDMHEVEYCYHEEPLDAYQSEQECKDHSTELMNETKLRQEFQLDYVRPIVRPDLEFWVDMRQEDVSDLSGVIAFNTADHDWNNSCVTVWFGRDVPWFFRRACDAAFQIVCQDTNSRWGNHSGGLLPRYGHEKFPQTGCFYHASHAWLFGYCVPEGHRFNISDGMEFCKSRSMELLRGSTLKELFYVYSHLEKHHNNNVDRYLVWDKNFRHVTAVAPGECMATSLHLSQLEIQSHKKLPCNTTRPYICRRQKRVRSDGMTDDPDDDPLCDNVRKVRLNFHACMNVAPLTYEESVTKCEGLGMKLLNQSLTVTQYENLIDGLDYAMHYSEAIAYWLLKNTRDHDHCAILVRNGGTYIQTGNCEAILPSVCVHDSGTENPPVGELHCPPKMQYNVFWPQASPGSQVERSCPRATTAKMRRVCGKDGHWGIVNDTECVSTTFKNATHAVMDENDFPRMIKELANFSANIETHSDLKAAADALGKIVTSRINSIAREGLPSQTRDIAGSLVTSVRGLMEKRHIWSKITQEERLPTAIGMMNVVENTVLKMLEYQNGTGSGSRIDLSDGNMRVETAKFTPNGLGSPVIVPVNESKNNVRLPANFLSGDHGDVGIIFAEYPDISSILHPPAEDKKTVHKRLATAVVTATVVHGNETVIDIRESVDLTFKIPQGYENPSCVFLDKEMKWSDAGCLVKRVTSEEVLCSCNHLTNFAVLMSPTTELENDGGLHWITVIGCVISIVCLTMCTAVFTFYRHLKGIRNTIHRNLCVSLLIGEVLLLVGLDKERPFVKTDGVCMTVAFLLHFFFLSAFAWMALEGCNIIVLLWKVFNQKRTYYERYYLAGYGIPLIISSTTFGIRHKYYGKGNVCWLPVDEDVRYSFIGPVAAVICLNVGALGLVHWKMSHVRMVVEKSTLEKVQNWIRGTVILLPILGLTWLLGFLMLGSNRLYQVGAYLFAAFNSLQGLGIFICHVLMSKKTREAITRSIVNTGSMISSRPSRSATSSIKKTWHPFRRPSNSGGVNPPPVTTPPNRDFNSQSSNSDTDNDGNPCPDLDCWPGTRFKYELKLGYEQEEMTTSDTPPDVSTLPRFRPVRQSEA